MNAAALRDPEPFGLLMEPGPTLVHPTVNEAAGRPPLHHLHPAFHDVVDHVCADLSHVLGARHTALLPATGRGAVEAAVATFGRPDEPVLVVRNGEFGDMLHAIATRHRTRVISHEAPSGQSVDFAAVRRLALAERPAVLMLVHSESSTGMLNDIAEAAAVASETGALLLVDAVSSAGATPIDADRLGIDVTVTASQKALGALTGLSSVSWSDRALDAIRTRPSTPSTYYLDLRRWWDLWITEENGGTADPGSRRLPWSMPTGLVLALERALELVRAESLAARTERHETMARRFRGLVRELGYSTLVEDRAASPSLTALQPPEGVSAASVLDGCARAGIRVAGGMGPLGGRLIRIGHMAESARPIPLARTATALAGAIGVDLDLEAAISRMDRG